MAHGHLKSRVPWHYPRIGCLVADAGKLIVPLTLFKHHLNRHAVPDWVHQQVYLHPYPKELMLRNHV
jgi:uncharacterized protein YbgA (DUF1722 family)